MWRDITWDDVPSVEEFTAESLSAMRNGVTNSDFMRDLIRRKRKLILREVDGRWDSTPSNKFVNQHAWALKALVVGGAIERVRPKEYRLVTRKGRAANTAADSSRAAGSRAG